jgi:hypothetical protein
VEDGPVVVVPVDEVCVTGPDVRCSSRISSIGNGSTVTNRAPSRSAQATISRVIPPASDPISTTRFGATARRHSKISSRCSLSE